MTSPTDESKVDVSSDSDSDAVDSELAQVTRIESPCLNCDETGLTTILPTAIPYFRKIVIMSFRCPECGYTNNEVQDFESLQSKGMKVSVSVSTPEDLNRQVIKASNATITIPEVEFEMPSQTQRGDINTIEGFLMRAADTLTAGQPVRAAIDPETTEKIQKVIDRVYGMAKGEENFTFVLDDPSGNSFVQNPNAPKADPSAKAEYYNRTREQTRACGYVVDEVEEKVATDEQHAITADLAAREKLSSLFVADNPDPSVQTATIPGICHSCHAPNETRMCVTDIPNFKEVVIMVTDCDECGFRDTEVKPSGQVSPQGCKITLEVNSSEDLKRDLLKSDSCGIEIPEMEFQMLSGTLGGKYTTVEGILNDMYNQLKHLHQFETGDSAPEDEHKTISTFLGKFKQLKSGEQPFTLILDDPLGNVFVGFSSAEKSGPDPEVKREFYTRTWEQNEDFGFNDINVDHYDDLSKLYEQHNSPSTTQKVGSSNAASESPRESDVVKESETVGESAQSNENS